MLNEIEIALEFLLSFLHNKIPRSKVKQFSESVKERLKTRFDGHWYPEMPSKGSAYRCISIGSHKIDDLICHAAQDASLDLRSLQSTFLADVSIWIDPNEVSYRIGDGGIKVLYNFNSISPISFDQGNNPAAGSSYYIDSNNAKNATSAIPWVSPPHQEFSSHGHNIKDSNFLINEFESPLSLSNDAHISNLATMFQQQQANSAISYSSLSGSSIGTHQSDSPPFLDKMMFVNGVGAMHPNNSSDHNYYGSSVTPPLFNNIMPNNLIGNRYGYGNNNSHNKHFNSGKKHHNGINSGRLSVGKGFGDLPATNLAHMGFHVENNVDLNGSMMSKKGLNFMPNYNNNNNGFVEGAYNYLMGKVSPPYPNDFYNNSGYMEPMAFNGTKQQQHHYENGLDGFVNNQNLSLGYYDAGLGGNGCEFMNGELNNFNNQKLKICNNNFSNNHFQIESSDSSNTKDMVGGVNKLNTNGDNIDYVSNKLFNLLVAN